MKLKHLAQILKEFPSFSANPDGSIHYDDWGANIYPSMFFLFGHAYDPDGSYLTIDPSWIEKEEPPKVKKTYAYTKEVTIAHVVTCRNLFLRPGEH
jgi:hypothetical protein